MIRTADGRHTFILVLGDVVTYFFSLILALAIRYGEIPGRALISLHVYSFSVLFVVFLIVNFSAGLYNKQTLFAKGRLYGLLIRSQAIGILLSVLFFYLAPVAIAPKANLFIYAVISTLLLLLWRATVFPVLSSTKKQKAILIGSGEEIRDLFEEVNTRGSYDITFAALREPALVRDSSLLAEAVRSTGSTVIVADLRDKLVESVMPSLYSLMFSGIQVIDAGKLYEAIFDRAPLTMVRERWLVENAGGSVGGRGLYGIFKRLTDIIFAFILGVISLVFYPFVYFAIKFDDKGPIFISQDRVGRGGKPIRIHKFRSMAAMNGDSHDDGGVYVNDVNVKETNNVKRMDGGKINEGKVNGGKSQLKITRVGKFIRLTRIDELPQLWNVLLGDISLIGPRPELPALVAIYEKEIPYYQVRHLVQPGLSGWAQIYHQAHPHHAVAVSDTRDKLSYDLYYVKNRSFTLDLRIAMQTLKALISRRGV